MKLTDLRAEGPKLFIQKYSTLIVLLLVFAAFSIFVENFLSLENLLNVIKQSSLLCIVGLGLTFGFVAGEMDLSIGASVGVASLIGPVLLVSGYSVAVSVLAALLFGVVMGAVNAFIVTQMKIPSIIGTLATGLILSGIDFILTRGQAIYGGIPRGFMTIGQDSFHGIPYLSMVTLGFICFAYLLMDRSFLGRYLYASGGNPQATEISGISPRKYKSVGLILCTTFGACAGILLASRLGSGQPNAGVHYLMDGLATVFIGMTMFRPGVATVAGTVFGTILIGIINNGLNLMGFDSFLQDIFKGIIIILAVSIVARQTKLKLL